MTDCELRATTGDQYLNNLPKIDKSASTKAKVFEREKSLTLSCCGIGCFKGDSALPIESKKCIS